jgi:hypothetical protein
MVWGKDMQESFSERTKALGKNAGEVWRSML